MFLRIVYDFGKVSIFSDAMSLDFIDNVYYVSCILVFNFLAPVFYKCGMRYFGWM